MLQRTLPKADGSLIVFASTTLPPNPSTIAAAAELRNRQRGRTTEQPQWDLRAGCVLGCRAVDVPGGKVKGQLPAEEPMIISTTDSIEGRTIASYLGVVSGDAVMGTNVFRDMFAGLRDLVGGRSGSYEKELRKAKQLALEEMAEDAKELGADAVVGVDLDYEHLGNEGRSMLMVSANGTAVKLA